MKPAYVDIHTHRPTGRGIELRTAGVHPWRAAEERVADLLPLAPGVQAVGETGLDFACRTDRAAQYAALREQLQLACERGLPVVLHCVRAFGEVMRCLAERTPRAVIFHGFVGSAQQAREALKRGYFLSFGERSFRSPRTVEAMRATPLAQLFLETDDGPAPIEEIYDRAARLLGVRVADLQRATTENYERIFAHGQLAGTHRAASR